MTDVIPWMQKPRTAPCEPVEPELTNAQVAGLFASALLTMPFLEKASVMNCLLHRAPRVFASLLLRESREDAGRFR